MCIGARPMRRRKSVTVVGSADDGLVPPTCTPYTSHLHTYTPLPPSDVDQHTMVNHHKMASKESISTPSSICANPAMVIPPQRKPGFQQWGGLAGSVNHKKTAVFYNIYEGDNGVYVPNDAVVHERYLSWGAAHV